MHDGTDPDATNLLEKGKLIAVPVVNPDGYDLSRSLQNEQKRKNCRDRLRRDPDARRVHGAANANRGIDNNRNYLPFWGGPGSSTSATASNTRGEAPGSEPENRGMIDLLNAQPDHGRDQQPHARPAAAARAELVQRAADRGRPRRLPGPARAPRTTTSRAGRPARGPTSTTRRRAPPSSRRTTRYGTFGFTPEATPGFSGAQTFHPPYQNVIDNYLGIGTRYAGQTMRGLYYDAFKAATEPSCTP